MNSRCFKLYRPYSILFNSSNLGNFFLGLSSKRLYRSSEKEEGSRFFIFTFSQNVKVVVMQWRQINVQKCVMHVQSRCFTNLNLFLYCRSCWRRLRRCLSSLLFLPGHINDFFKWLCCSCGGIVSNFIDYHTSFSLLFYHFYTLKHFSRVSTLVVSKRKDGRGWETIYENSAN